MSSLDMLVGSPHPAAADGHAATNSSVTSAAMSAPLSQESLDGKSLARKAYPQESAL